MASKRKRRLDKIYIRRRIALGIALVGVVALAGYSANWIRSAVAAPQDSSSTSSNSSTVKSSSDSILQNSSEKNFDSSDSQVTSWDSQGEPSSSVSASNISSSSTPPLPLDDWRLTLVNPWVPLAEDFEVDLVDYGSGYLVDGRIKEELKTMLNDAYVAGHRIYICSAFRTQEFQQKLFDNQVSKFTQSGYSQEDAVVEAAKWVALPGTSEHQLGLAIDILAVGYEYLDNNQPDLPHYKWMYENSYKYGFILRYAQDKVPTTGIVFEPWHYRYVGKEVAKEIYESGECLEEYLERISPKNS